MNAQEIKELSDEILELSSLYTTDPNTIRYFLESGVYRENAEKRLLEILRDDTDDSERCPTTTQFKIAVLAISLVLDKEDVADIALSDSERWLFAD